MRRLGRDGAVHARARRRLRLRLKAQVSLPSRCPVGRAQVKVKVKS